MSNLFVTVTNREFSEQLRADPEGHMSDWTIGPRAWPGDRFLVYVTKPVQAIVASVEVETVPSMITDPQSVWYQHYSADVTDLQWLSEPLARSELLEQFPEWGYWKQPRCNHLVPAQYVEAFRSIVRSRVPPHLFLFGGYGW